MKVIRTYKRKLKLNRAQESRIEAWMNTCRFLHNMSLEIQNASYQVSQKILHKYELSKQLTDIRNIDWIKDVPVWTQQRAIYRLDKAYRTFFDTRKEGGGRPKFVKKGQYRSIAFRRARVRGNSISLPKIGPLRIFKDSPIIGVIKTAIIIKNPSGYFICLQCENVPKRFTSENQAVGIDMGISHFCIKSDGEFTANPRHFTKYERMVRVENRSLARKKKGSNRWKKQASKLSRVHHKISNVRRDFLHKESTKIAKRYSTVYVEALNISGMARNRKLSKHILDCGWGNFMEMLRYKTNVIPVDPKHTSQTCVECGSIDKKSRVSQSEFVCTVCGITSNADVNAAKNIMSKGIALSLQREPRGCA